MKKLLYHKQKKIISALLLPLILALLFSGCKNHTIESQTRSALGTICTISLFENGNKSLYDALFGVIDSVEQKMSTTIPTSEIVRLNEKSKTALLQNENVENFVVSKDTYAVLQRSLEIATITEGAFDPTIGTLTKLWDINERAMGVQKPIPNQNEIENALSFVNWENVRLNFVTEENGDTKYTVSLLKAGLQIELGGIAKGFCADKIVSMLNEKGVSRAIIDLGGNIYAYGAKGGNANGDFVPWKIGIKNPLNSENPVLKVVDCVNKTVVTSGSYERFFEQNGKIYHHILDTKTGYPVETDLVSVSIVATNSMTADSISTAFFALGFEKSAHLIEKLDKTYDEDIQYLFLYKDGSTKTTLSAQ